MHLKSQITISSYYLVSYVDKKQNWFQHKETFQSFVLHWYGKLVIKKLFTHLADTLAFMFWPNYQNNSVKDAKRCCIVEGNCRIGDNLLLWETLFMLDVMISLIVDIEILISATMTSMAQVLCLRLLSCLLSVWFPAFDITVTLQIYSTQSKMKDFD